ncbi:unnamed protein product [Dibothriocephalus latus]|uniref:Rab proteins geranylgeranyltransferase component A n=1 Tax=Dibothriocephalus latus TaxID=60516 RepID=A0A3P7P0B5_DIBLA|nr:unnamed protein product [Dibothriocephalus latus]
MELPTEFDYVIVGTGLIESVVAASLSITGNSVLHIDSENYYGGLMSSFRFPDLLDKLTEWEEEEKGASSAPTTLADRVQPADTVALAESSDREVPTSPPPCHWSQASMKQRLHRLDLDIWPKLIYADSPTVAAMLRADVTRYLEFRPVSRLLTFAFQAPKPQASTPPPQPSSSSNAAGTNTLPTFQSLIKVKFLVSGPHVGYKNKFSSGGCRFAINS